jgi:hypothetical protein
LQNSLQPCVQPLPEDQVGVFMFPQWQVGPLPGPVTPQAPGSLFIAF